MRKWIYTSLLICTALPMPGGIRADNGPQISLSVKEDVNRVRTKDRKGDVAKWPFFSIYRDASIKNCTLRMTVSGQSEKDVPCQLEWYFISEKTPVQEPSMRVIDTSESESITETIIRSETPKPVLAVVYPGKNKIVLPPQNPVEKTATAIFEYARIVVDAYDNESGDVKTREYFEGDTYVGYIVLVTVDGKIVAKTSDKSWLLNDQWIKRCQNK